jgi:hydroxylysine kinase
VLLPPRVSRDQAEEIAAAHYGISVVAERLAAEHDDTFRLVTADGTTRLLKIAQRDADASPASFQTAVLLHLARAAPALPVQRVIGTLDGRPELRLDGRVVRMTSYLEGPVLGSVADPFVTPAPPAPMSGVARIFVSVSAPIRASESFQRGQN